MTAPRRFTVRESREAMLVTADKARGAPVVTDAPRVPCLAQPIRAAPLLGSPGLASPRRATLDLRYSGRRIPRGEEQT